jgi:integrase
MPSLHLTDLTIRSLKAEQRTDFWCTRTPGFGVRVGARSKTFIAKVQNRRITIGAYPALSLSDARRKALAFKSKADPTQTPKMTFKEALAAFYDEHVPALKLRTQREIKRTLDRHFAPKFKTKRLAEISHRDIVDITGKLLDTPSEAWHAFKDARTFFNWCVPRYIPNSPCAGLKSPTRYIPRKRVLTYDEIKTIWYVLDTVEYPFSQIVKLLILTGCRYGEIASLRWPFINEKERTVTLPQTKNKDQHTFPYGRLVASILEAVPRLNSTDLLFPGREDRTPWNGAGKAKWLLDKECNLDGWQLLDCRRTFGTKLAELKVPPHIVERLLNHKLGTLSNQTSGAVTAIAEVYNRYLYLDEMRAAIDAWENHLASLLAAAPANLNPA